MGECQRRSWPFLEKSAWRVSHTRGYASEGTLIGTEDRCKEVRAMTRVLLVDDDQAIRETLRFALEDAGYQVLEAADGIAALQALRATPTGMVVLLDLMMPK